MLYSSFANRNHSKDLFDERLKAMSTILLNGLIDAAAQMSKDGDNNDWYPLAIKPAYIVLAGVGGGCILLVITAVVILCEYSLNKSFYTTNGSGPSPNYHVHEQRQQEAANDYVDGGGDTEDMGMSEVEMDIDKKPYGNAEEFQRD